MIQPDFKIFSALAGQGNLVPVYENYTADLLTPVGAYLRIAHKAKYSFLLESVEGGETIARYTIAGAIGYFADDMVRLVERIPATGRDDVGLDDCVMMFYLGLLAFDHVQHRVWVIRNVFTDGPGSLREKYDAAVAEIRRTRKLLEGPLPKQPRTRRAAPLRVRSNMTKSQFTGAGR